MKVIFSRQGFDSSYGGYPSIILPEEMGSKMISFPIPEAGKRKDKTNITVGEIEGKGAEKIIYKLGGGITLSLEKILKDLTKSKRTHREEIKNPANDDGYTLIEDTIFHYDPQIQEIDGGNNYAALGQSGAAASHLLNENIEKGDIFLFFGRFRETTRDEDGVIKYRRGTKEYHVIWGYMIVDDIFYIIQKENCKINEKKYDICIKKNNELEVVDDNYLEKYKNIDNHPHCLNSYSNPKYKKNTNIIICGKTFGTFKYTFKIDDVLRLTQYKSSNLTNWEIPNFWGYPKTNPKISMTYNTENKKEILKNGNLKIQSASIGQEFVINKYDPKIMKDWLEKVLRHDERFKQKLIIEKNSLVWKQL